MRNQDYSFAKRNGVARIAFVSSIGAKTPTSSFYLDLKGKTEQSLIELGFDHTLILRPSVLVGQRTEFRLAEHLSIVLLNALQFIPFLKRYKPIHTRQVAAKMVKCLAQQTKSVNAIENDVLHQ